jgi:hypothetical protein
MKFVKENKISKEWKTMKISIDFENGMVLTLKPENISLIDNGGKGTVAVTRTDNAIIPLVFFKSLLATPAELKAREDAAAAKDAADKAANPPTGSDADAAAMAATAAAQTGPAAVSVPTA